MQVLGVRTAPVETRPTLTRTVRATGVVQFNERKLAVVTSRVGGWVEKLDVAATGDAVKRGQVLAEIYSPDLVASEEEYLVAVRLGGGSLAAASLQRYARLQLLLRMRHPCTHMISSSTSSMSCLSQMARRACGGMQPSVCRC